MEKYYEIKEKHPDYLLIFRNADFWEMYANDATIASRVLNIDIRKQTHGHGQTLLMIRFPCNELDKTEIMSDKTRELLTEYKDNLK